MQQHSVSTHNDLKNLFQRPFQGIGDVIHQYPMKINPFVAKLIVNDPDGPLYRQYIPDIEEVNDAIGTDDPLSESLQSPVKQIIHRYPDRVVFLISNTCPSFCRFCMRKRFIGKQPQVSKDEIKEGLDYISKNLGISEVILSGGDPFMQTDQLLLYILGQLKQFSHIQIIRIHSRIPILMPEKITPELISQLRDYHPIYINLHINHAKEITNAAQATIENLSNAGFPLGSQTVLLKGINDNPDVMMHLMKRLLSLRIRPYYIHQMDDTQGTRHFQTSIETGIHIMECLRGHMSGMGVPHFMIDLPGGGGKIPLLPEYVRKHSKSRWVFKNYEGKIIEWNSHINE